MKIVFIVLSVLSFSFAYKDCSIVAPRKVICHGDSSSNITSIFTMKNDGNFINKTFQPEENGSSVLVSSHVVNIKPYCIYAMNSTYKDSISDSSNYWLEFCDSICVNLEKELFEDIKKGIQNHPFGFIYSISKPQFISVMFCDFEGSHEKVVTYKFNKITGLQTNRKEYKKLKIGTYCEDFFATENLFWSPSK